MGTSAVPPPASWPTPGYLVDQARVIAQINKITYDENSPSRKCWSSSICDFKQNYTQYGGVRPFGTALLVAGVDEHGEHLFETDPAGPSSPIRPGASEPAGMR